MKGTIAGFSRCVLALVLGAACGLASAAGDPGDAALVEALRQGGYNIYFRHAQTDWSQSDRIGKRGDWKSCDPQRIRQLSAQGRTTAREIGDAIRRLGIPVGRLLASPYCRAVETLEMMGLGDVGITDDVINMRVAEYFGGREAVIRRARALLSTTPPAGSNTLIAAHGNVARAATPVYPGEAEGVVFLPLGNGRFEYVARVGPERWTALAEEFGRDG